MSSFEIVPNSIQVLPNDKQALRLRLTSLAPMWTALTNATVNAAGKIEPTNPALNYLGYGVHALAAGIGSVSFTLTADMFPPSGGTCGANLQDNDSSVFLGWQIDGTAGTLRFYNETGTVFSMAYTPTVGDVLKLEAAGLIWRGYLNDVEKASYTPATGIDYHCFYSAGATAPLAATPSFPPPILEGEWTVISDATWDAPAHGALANSTGAENTYSGGTVPGRYPIKARFAGSALQEAVGEIVIPPLMLAMPNAVVAKPTDVVELLTNYDKAQTHLVTWTALDGGVLHANRFTPLAAPANYRVRASVGQQRALVTVTVPIVIQPATSSGQKKLIAIGLGANLQLVTNLGSPTWSAVAGSITSGGLYTPPAFVGADVITVTSGPKSQSVLVEIVEVFPFDPDFGYTVEEAKTVVVNRTEDDEPYGRVKSPANQPRRKYELKFQGVGTDDLAIAEDFWNRHFPDRVFIYDDKFRGEKVACYFDSNLKYEPGAGCDVDYSFRLIEA